MFHLLFILNFLCIPISLFSFFCVFLFLTLTAINNDELLHFSILLTLDIYLFFHSPLCRFFFLCLSFSLLILIATKHDEERLYFLFSLTFNISLSFSCSPPFPILSFSIELHLQFSYLFIPPSVLVPLFALSRELHQVDSKIRIEIAFGFCILLYGVCVKASADDFCRMCSPLSLMKRLSVFQLADVFLFPVHPQS